MPDATRPSPEQLLLQIGAVGIEPGEPFTFASGLTSPMYCDNRLFLSRPAERRQILEHLYSLIDEAAGSDWDAVAGVASAGIPFAAWVAEHFDRAMVYVRPAEKDHGRQRRIEGGLAPGKRVVLVEDLVTTGGSAVSAIAALREGGYVCGHCLSIFDYGFAAAPRLFRDNGVKHQSLTDFYRLLPVMRERGQIDEVEMQRVRSWHERADSAPASVTA
jgi:orotate phosphoribosyltransferase